MTKPIWITPAGFLGTITQRTHSSTPIVVQGTDVAFSVISGKLPEGLVLNAVTTSTNTSTTCFIAGNPTGVPDVIRSNFVVRAKNNDGIADRTFSIDVEGAVKPMWVTDQGLLPVGTSGEFFTVNNNIVDFQFYAEPNVLFSNQKMRYYIGEGDGQLPPGLKLDENGRVTGIVEEDLTIEESAYIGGYDTGFYDAYPYDIVTQENGNNTRPRFYTKIYRFRVTASDGISSEKRLFSIQIYDANTLRADTTYIRADASYYANSGYLFAPIWLSPANLGSRRSANYQIINLSTYDPFPSVGPVRFEWDTISVNPEIRALANSPADVYGAQTTNRQGDNTLHLKDLTSLPAVGQYFRLDSYVEEADSTEYEITSVTGDVKSCVIGFRYNPRIVNNVALYDTTLKVDVRNDTVLFLGSKSVHPEGFKLDPASGDLYGQIAYIPAYSIDYKFTIRTIKTDGKNGNTVRSDRIFSLRLKGDVESTISWLTDNMAGRIKTGYQSEIFVKAVHTDSTLDVQYTLIGGQLPNGLELKRDGTIVGKLPYGNLTYVDLDSDFKIDGGTTTIDRHYNFSVRATDIYRLSAIDKTFYIQIDENSTTPFSSIYVRPFMSRQKRREYRNFILDDNLFDKKTLYRPNDPAFGLQSQIKMTLEFGIQRLNLADYVYKLQTYFYNKRFWFGDVKSVIAKDEDGKEVYEMVYVDIIDDQENIKSKTPDSVTVLVNQELEKVFVNSVDNWQAALQGVELDGSPIQVDEYLRPRYMRTIQDNGQPLGFIKAVPICYVKPGYGATTVRKIQLSGFDFKLIDFEVDRLIIDKTIDNPGDKYLKFPVTGITYTYGPDVLAGPDGIILEAENGDDLLTEK